MSATMGTNDDTVAPTEDVTCGSCGATTSTPPLDGGVEDPMCSQCGEPLLDSSDSADANAAAIQDAGDSGITSPNAGEEYTGDGVRGYPAKASVIRSSYGPGAIELRSDAADGGTTLCGYFSTFGTWYEIDSYWEGQFLESVDSRAFDQTIAQDKASMRVLFDHGMDPQLGNKPLGPVADLRADATGAYYEVPLLDTDYNRDFVLPALQGRLMDGTNAGSQLGASFRFIVTAEEWDQQPARSDHNPDGIPERVIMRAQVMEFGPVTFPASPTATAGVRSLTDDFVSRLRTDPRFAARFTERAGLKVTEKILAATADGHGTRSNTKAADGDAARQARADRRKRQIAARHLKEDN